MDNVSHSRPGSKPPDDNRLQALRAACAAARQIGCDLCWTGPLEECAYSTAPVTTPVTAGIPVRPVRGYHVARLQQAAGQELIAAAGLGAVTAGLASGAVVWDDGSAPRPAPGREPMGPFETEADVRRTAAVQAIYDAFDAAPGAGRMQAPNHQLLEEACASAGVELGAYDHRILLWLAGWEPQVCAVVAGWVGRARPGAGIAAEDLATIRQALADASAWRTWKTGGDRDADAAQAAAYEQLLRCLVTEQEVQ